MRYLMYLFIGVLIISSSCAGTNKRLAKNKTTVSKNVDSKVEEIESSQTTVPIKEVEERLVPIDEVKPKPNRYFVIIGSFRNPDNAKKYQGQILKYGFNSEILKNDQGLYRVSVLATDDISAARADIRRIRITFPKYSDTWLLIQKD